VRDEVRSLVGDAQTGARLRDGQSRAFVWRNGIDQRFAEELAVLKQQAAPLFPKSVVPQPEWAVEIPLIGKPNLFENLERVVH
jgi:hypothetical protein